jgi:hypothetical protein
MEVLPYELIEYIGTFLPPRWRYFLYSCCKIWRQKCAIDDQMRHCKLYWKVNKSISQITYKIYSYIYPNFSPREWHASIILIPKYILIKNYIRDKHQYKYIFSDMEELHDNNISIRICTSKLMFNEITGPLLREIVVYNNFAEHYSNSIDWYNNTKYNWRLLTF